VWTSDRLAAQCNHAEAHQICLSHLIRDAQYAIDDGDSVFAPKFKGFLKRCCEIGGRRPDLADSTIKAYARTLGRDLDELLKLKLPNDEGRHGHVMCGLFPLYPMRSRMDVRASETECTASCYRQNAAAATRHSAEK
jgi:hypothetical protein